MNDTSKAAAPSAKKPAPHDEALSEAAGPSARKSPDEEKFTDFNGSATTFAEIVRKQTYLDKSLFIKTIFNPRSWDCHLITAPRRFGKSTILNMLKHFVAIEVDVNGERKAEKYKKNRRLFEEKLYDGKSFLKILKEGDIMKKHFGRYPVIHVDFKCDGVIHSYDAAVRRCKRVLRAAYVAHEYLIRSPQLKKHEVAVCENWINNQSIEEEDITDGLKELAKYLFKHYKGKSVFVLVDEYDSVIMNALFDADGKSLCNIAKFCMGILSAVVKTSDEEDNIGDRGKCVTKVVITGISHIAGVGFSGMNNVKSVPFLLQTQFLDYYGLTESEVDELLKRLKDTDNKITKDDLSKHYNGYFGGNRVSIYPLWSVLNCLDTQKRKQYYKDTGTIERLSKAFQIPSIRSKVQQLVVGLNVPIKFNEKICPEDLVELHNLFSEPEKQETLEADLFFSFLFEQGYLSFDPENYPKEDALEVVDVKIPNEEIKKIFEDKLAKYYKHFCKFDNKKRETCRTSLKTLISSENDTFKANVVQLHKALQDLLQDVLSKETCLKLNEAALHTSVCFVFFQSGFKYTTEYIIATNKRLDLAVVQDDCGIVLEFKYDSGQTPGTTAADALKQIKTNKYSTVFDNNKIFAKKPGKIILMGVSINNDKELSIACVIEESKMETVYIPDDQKTGKSSSKRIGSTKTGQRAKSSRKN